MGWPSVLYTIKLIKENGRSLRALTQTQLEETRTAQQLRAIVSQRAAYDALALDVVGKLYRIIHANLNRAKVLFNLDNFDSLDVNKLPRVEAREIKIYCACLEKLISITRQLLEEDESVNSIAEELKLLRAEEKDSLSSEDKLNQLEHQLSELKRARKSLNERRNSSLTRVK